MLTNGRVQYSITLCTLCPHGIPLSLFNCHLDLVNSLPNPFAPPAARLSLVASVLDMINNSLLATVANTVCCTGLPASQPATDSTPSSIHSVLWRHQSALIPDVAGRVWTGLQVDPCHGLSTQTSPTLPVSPSPGRWMEPEYLWYVHWGTGPPVGNGSSYVLVHSTPLSV